VTRWNEGARRIMGYPAEEILGRPVHRFYTPEDIATHKPESEMQTALALGRSEDESWRVRKDGSRFWGNEIMTPLRSEAGTLLGFTKITADLSERRRMEEKLEEQVRERTAQVRSLVTQLTLSEQEERRRISTILHDDLQQRLFSLIFHLTLMRQSLDGHNAELAQHFLETEEELRDAVHITRELSVDLSPPVLHNEGLTEAIQWLAVQMEQQQGLNVELQVIGEVALLHEDLRVLLFQIVRELLFNVVKHAKVDAVKVVLTYTGGNVRIEVGDQGQGFVPEHANGSRPTGQGLPRMEQRLQLLGGRMEVLSTPGVGTHITLEIPLQGHERNGR
jgi:PAS domain S-box-containing protein